MPRAIKVNGAKALLAVLFPAIQAAAKGDWIEVQPGIRVRLNDDIALTAAANPDGSVNVDIQQPLSLDVDAGAWVCHADLQGRITGLRRVTQTGAQLDIDGLPDQILEFT